MGARRRGNGESRPGGQPNRNPNTPPKKKKPANRSRAVDSFFSERPPPKVFVRRYVGLKNPLALMRATDKERNALVRGLIGRLGLRNYVAGFTVVPGGLVEVVFPDFREPLVKQAVLANGLTWLDVADPFAVPSTSKHDAATSQHLTARRLAAMCMQSRARAFHECVLGGASEELRDDVLSEYRKRVKDPKALLGHEGRPYSKSWGKSPVRDGQTMDTESGDSDVDVEMDQNVSGTPVSTGESSQ